MAHNNVCCCSGMLNIVTEYHIDHLELKPGVKYFSQIKACNSAYLCTSSQSDGITVDGTPPHLGPVLDGLYDEDTDYQPTKYRPFSDDYGISI